MEIYSQTVNGTLYQGDCFEVLSLLPSDSIDTMITDPPYGLSFMGKKWDYEVPGVNVWKQCLRVLKPGATALIFAGSRTQHRMAVNVEDAGFILKDTIMWIYGSGFPKSTDISKQIDKSAGKEKIIGYEPDRWTGKGSVLNFSTDRSQKYSKITVPATNEAKTWNGWGTALKPAYEPILVAMKPNDGTYAQNALKHGVAGLNIDGGRIGGQEYTQKQWEAKGLSRLTGNTYGKHKPSISEVPKGRFPANIILDEEAGRLLDEQSGILKSGGYQRGSRMKTKLFDKDVKVYGVYGAMDRESTHSGDTGGASRFFYCAKASKAERNAGCEELEERFAPTMGNGIGIKEHDPISATKKNNTHPTVKPLALMEYLVKLTATPTGGTVFDPFAGSGTTGVACILNNRKYTLIEREIEYCEIIMARLGYAWFKNLC